MKKIILPFTSALFIISLDLYTKFAVLNRVGIKSLFKWLEFTPSIKEVTDSSLPNYIFIILIIIVGLISIYLSTKSTNFSTIERYSIWIFLGGVIGNYINPTLFIKITTLSILPLCNIGYIAVVISGVIMLVSLITDNRS